ncbi:MAG TPA: protease HtpX [Succinivibrionaceae bacterium]|nr:protease HtpX [Succinivibrio sp.]HAR80514.1 protease HtpX [Succinivibrionaceae bacterium]
MRALLFIGMQIAILLVVSIVGNVLMYLFGVQIDSTSYLGLLCMCAVYGCVGSAISLFMSKMMCKKAYRVRVIEVPRTQEEQFLVSTVTQLASQAGFNTPEIGIYNSPDPNAFATGHNKNAALVAVSSGLLNSMSREEIKGVLGHEISHIKNGDMVTMALLQGVLNTFVYFLSYIVASIAANALRGNRDSSSSSSFSGTFMFYAINSLMQMLFGFAATIVLMWFSRWREFRADAGSADLNGKECMIKALEALKRGVQPQSNEGKASMQALCINGASNLSVLFMSHPPLDKRIEALRSR